MFELGGKSYISRKAGNIRSIVVILLLFGIIFCLCSCGHEAGDNEKGLHHNAGHNSQTDYEEGKISIVCTLFPQYDFVRQIAGEYADVTLLLPPGMESHSYDLRPADMITIRESDMFIYTGKYMETWAQTIIDSLDDSVMVVDVSEGIELTVEEHYDIEANEDEHAEDEHAEDEHAEDEHAEDEHAEDEHAEDEHAEDEHAEDEHDENEHDIDEIHENSESWLHAGHHHEFDPHIWTDPVFAIQMVENITVALCEADFEHSAFFINNANEYIRKLMEIDDAFRDIAQKALDSGNNTIYFGGRFAMGYFVREYSLNCVAAYSDCSAESEPSIANVMKIIDEIEEHDVKVIYYEELTDPKVARTIAEETGCKLMLLHSAHNVSKEDFDAGITYLDIMWQNIANLKEGIN